MKSIKKLTLMTDHELSDRLIEIATELGLSIPQTANEVEIFEEKFATEIRQANMQIPDLKKVLALAEELETSNKQILAAKKVTLVDEKYQMAARNGKNLSEETHSKIDKVLKKHKEKLNSESK